MSEFTPGPWEPVRSLTCGHLRAGHNYNTPEPKKEWTDADIRLIAAAPELYEALTELYQIQAVSIDEPWDDDRYFVAMEKAEAAIKKARGE